MALLRQALLTQSLTRKLFGTRGVWPCPASWCGLLATVLVLASTASLRAQVNVTVNAASVNHQYDFLAIDRAAPLGIKYREVGT